MESVEEIKQLKETIATLESQRLILGDLVVDASVAALQKQIADLRSPFTEERKLVSILFCDIVGSSNMAANRDPEDVLNIVSGALHEMNMAVENLGGTVITYMGDGILAVFGAPKAQEQHAEQAVRAALAIQDRISAYGSFLQANRGLYDFKVRVGVNSGRVVGGGVGTRQGEYTVIGDAVNMAARFEAAAPPGGVLIGETTFQLAGGEDNFETKAWEPIEVKGSPKPQPVYQVLRGRKSRQSRVSVQAPMTGRNSELSVLQAAFQRVSSQLKPEIIHVIGPAGIGKSRLRHEFISWLETLSNPPQVSLGSALGYTANIPYGLVSSLLNATLDMVDTDLMERRREKLHEGLKAAGELSAEHRHGLAALTAVDLEDSKLDDLEPQTRRNVIFESFVTFWSRKSRQSAVVLILEDTHWADALSLDLIYELLVDWQGGQLMLVFFTRSDSHQDVRYAELRAKSDEAAFIEIYLHELDSAETRLLVQGLLASKNVPAELVSAIDEQAEGNPFFVEEIVNSFLEDGTLVHQKEGWKLTSDLAEIQVPDTVQGVLAARIDRLDPDDKQTLQHAAIIGRSFAQQVLAGILEREIEESLSNLSERDFITKMGRATLTDDWEWLFRHVLVQEVAYESVLVEVRRKLHCRIANYLEAIAPDRIDELAPTMALHFERGGLWDRAIFYLTRTAERAAGEFALREALASYDQAVELAEKHPENIPQETLLEIYEKRGDVRALAYEFEGAESDFRLGLAAARRDHDQTREQSLLVRLGFLYRTADRLEEAVEYLKTGLDVARQSGDLRAVADILYHLGTVAWTEGDNNTALAYQQEAADICRELGLSDLVAVQALHGLAEAQQWAGNPREAVENYKQSIILSRQIGDKSYESENLYMLADCLGYGGIGDYELARQSVNLALDISRMARMDGHSTPALLVAGFIYGRAGDYQQGFSFLNEALAWSEKLGVIRFQTAVYIHMAILYREINLDEKARDVDALGLQIAEDHGVGFYLLGLRAGLAIDRLRLGDLDVGQELLESYDLTRRKGQWMHGVSYLQGLAEWALASGELQDALNYSLKMGEIAAAGGMRDNAARARIYQGQVFTALGDFEAAETELKIVQKVAAEIKGVRLQWDTYAALEKLYRAWGKDAQADLQLARVITIVNQIRENLKADDLKVGLPDFPAEIGKQ